jgi:hypothetical protein
VISPPPVWSAEELEKARLEAIEHFRTTRVLEPLERYREIFEQYQGVVEEFLELTIDLRELDLHARALLCDPIRQEVFRYLTGPPVSRDDLVILIQATGLSERQLACDPDIIVRAVQFIRDYHDRMRFPWLGSDWEPNEQDRKAAILATTALLAMRRLETLRRNEGKEEQEEMVAEALSEAAGFKQVPTRRVQVLSDAPKAGEFCRESILGDRKADFIVGLWDGRTMPVECKVSNSTTNSIKRLNNDAAVKATAWRKDFGDRQVVPVAVLGGCYKLRNLENAQRRGLTLFWAHDLQAMLAWIATTETP